MRGINNFGDPKAFANISDNNSIDGIMYLYEYDEGSFVELELINMPNKKTPFAVHIHSGTDCIGNGFPNALSHYDENNNEHPLHSGDLPSIFSNNGYSYFMTFTNRFKPIDVIGRVVIIHDSFDDFKSQPSGNSGNKMACGLIQKIK